MQRPHILFDPDFYLSTNPDVAALGEEPFSHFSCQGAFEGRNPHALFDVAWYLDRNADVATARDNPLTHYMLNGWKEGRNPHPLFETRWYLERNPDVAEAGENPLMHYLMHGWKEGRNPHPLFDAVWYNQQRTDIADGTVSPLEHYIRIGAGVGLTPHPLFDARWYHQQYRDVVGNALEHFVKFGAIERRNPHPLFDTEYYLGQNSGALKSEMNPLVHYLEWGAVAGYNPHRLFDTAWYQAKNLSNSDQGANPLVHYLMIGAAASLDPNPDFDTLAYRARNVDLEAGRNALLHYIQRGELPPKGDRPRIQIFRIGAMGDVLLLTPAIKALKMKRPNAEIVVTTAFPQILERNPYIDHIVKARQPCLGCDETYVMDYELAPEKHLVQAYADILGVPLADRTPEIFLEDSEQEAAAEALRLAGVAQNDKFCVMQISTGWKTRNWEIGRFAAVARALEGIGVRALVLGDAKHPSIDFGIDLRGETPLRIAAAIIARSAMMVTVDSGLLHVGLAFRRPTVSLFGCTSPEKRVPDWALATALFADIPCHGCHHRQPPPALREPMCLWETIRCMDELSAASVIETALGQTRVSAKPQAYLA